MKNDKDNTTSSPKKGVNWLDEGLAITTMHAMNIAIDRAEGVWLYPSMGQPGVAPRLMDLISGLGVSGLGHANPAILRAVHDQVDRYLHVMVYGELAQEPQFRAAEALLNLLPSYAREKREERTDSVGAVGLGAAYFVNSGAEAVDGAIKLARRVTEKSGVVACYGGYHGNTLGALSVSDCAERRAPFEPLIPEVVWMPFIEASEPCMTATGARSSDAWNLGVITTDHAAVILETVQGDAGVRIPDAAWLRAVRERCSEVGALLVFDEVQAGMGRTGRPFAFEHFEVVPDILVLGKGLGGGMPIGAFLSSRERMGLLAQNPALGHITTFGGHPVACAAAAAACSEIAGIDWDAVRRRGARLAARLRKISGVQAVRQIGYFLAVELRNADAVNRAIKAGLQEGVFLFWFLSVPNAFRLAPPLIITDHELEEAAVLLERVLSRC